MAVHAEDLIICGSGVCPLQRGLLRAGSGGGDRRWRTPGPVCSGMTSRGDWKRLPRAACTHSVWRP